MSSVDTQITLLVVAIGLGGAVALLVFSGLSYWFSAQRKVNKRLDEMVDYIDSELAEAEPLSLPFAQRVLAPVAEQMITGARSLTPHDFLLRVKTRLATAGKLSTVTPEKFMLMKAGGALAGLALGTAGAQIYGLGFIQAIPIGIAAAIGGSFLPDSQMKSWSADRRKQILRALPDMLDMLMISVQAGLGFDQAVTRYVAHSSGPLAEEFNQALLEIQAGKSRRESFRALGDRADEPALRSFVMAIVQADVFGVSVADVLRAQSYELRTKRRQLAEEEAKKAPVKMTLPMMGCILPTIILVVMTPVAVSLVAIFSSQ